MWECAHSYSSIANLTGPRKYWQVLYNSFFSERNDCSLQGSLGSTDFTLDVVGRYICNTLDEALLSTDKSHGRSDARPFDIVVIGGGTFGAAIAQFLFYRDKSHSHRILVLDAGKIVLTEHVQNLPMLGLTVPAPIMEDPGHPRQQIWGLPWRSNVKKGFPGIAYCIGGRSLFFGGWSPRLLEAEMKDWPPDVRDELIGKVSENLTKEFDTKSKKQGYFDEAASLIGTNTTNDFIFGDLHKALRKQLYKGINKVTDAIPLVEMDAHLEKVKKGMRDEMKLEAPLAVHGRASRSGFFPLNKFSSVPLLTEATRAAQYDSDNDNVRKRLMVVPDIHVMRLITEERVSGDGSVTEHVKAVQTNKGNIPVPESGIVIIALGTIESTRLALLSFNGIPDYDLIGKNLMVHLRSNLTVRFHRDKVLDLKRNTKELQASALFVKGSQKNADGTSGFFHLQITAAGLNGLGTDSEAELFKKIPNIDLLPNFLAIDDTHVVMTIRGIGETQSQNSDSYVSLSAEVDEFGMNRAFVSIAEPNDAMQKKSKNDWDLWKAMEKAADQVADIFAKESERDTLTKIRDGLATTHHEAGTLWMGEKGKSVTNSYGCFHSVTNAYVVGPALFPRIGSPNPVLTGIALARRTAKKIIPDFKGPAKEEEFIYLFDGSDDKFKSWQEVGPGSFSLINGEIVAYPGTDHSLLFYSECQFKDFVLNLQFRLDTLNDNSGIFLRFRNPLMPWPDLSEKEGMNTNRAWTAAHTGFEVQIDEQAPEDKFHTGAIYGIEVKQEGSGQDYGRPPKLLANRWYDYEITVKKDTYEVKLDGKRVTIFTNPDNKRGRPWVDDVKASREEKRSGYIALQAHNGRVAFRNILIKRI